MKWTVRICFLLIPLLSEAQTPAKVIHTREQAWVAYFNQTRLTSKWGLWLDVHYRMTDNFVDRPFQLLIRPGVTYYLKDNVRLTAGYGLVEHYPAKGLSTTRRENRVWQQVAWTQKYQRFSTLQWLRLEQRFSQKVVNDVKTGDYVYTSRVRYNFSFFIPLKGKELAPKTPFITIANEVFLNFGKNVVYNTFDQNRLFVGFGYQFDKHLNAQLGYMNVFQQDASGSNYFSSNAIRLFVYHSLDFRSGDMHQ
jgi:hypothetical protein